MNQWVIVDLSQRDERRTNLRLVVQWICDCKAFWTTISLDWTKKTRFCDILFGTCVLLCINDGLLYYYCYYCRIYETTFKSPLQLSPVEIRKRVNKAYPKFLKCACLLIPWQSSRRQSKSENVRERYYVQLKSLQVLKITSKIRYYNAQKMKFSIKDFLSKRDQIRRKLRFLCKRWAKSYLFQKFRKLL